MLKKIIQILLALAATIAPAYAGEQTGKVTMVISRDSDGMTYFYMDGTATGRASCATVPYWIIRDENSAAGKRLLAMVLAARATGQTITVWGKGTCARWFDGEDVNGIGF